MTLKSANINALWGKLLIEELVRHDITRFYISPGSRSTPLTIAAAENQSTNCNICLDERAAAFRALGFSRAAGRPAVLICSSGTAGANYFPAIIEASVDRIPMIIITADRPPELRETAANQTIRQIPFYSGHTRWQFDMPCPTIEIPAQFILTTAAQIVSRSLSPEPGPVHLNCMFREPLAPLDKPVSPEYIKPVSNWYSSSIPFTELNLPLQNLTKTAQKKIYDYLSAPSGILSVGRLRSQNEAKAVEQLAIKSNWLLATDISSGLRFSDSFPNMLRYHDQLLLSSSFADALPKRILHIGDPPLSKRWLKQMNRDDTELACIQSSPDRQDPFHHVSNRIIADIATVCNDIIAILPGSKSPQSPPIRVNIIRQKIDDICSDEKSISEVAVAKIVSEELDNESALFLAASMPVRDMDMYASYSGKMVSVAANRGASGIDGTLASACGYAEGNQRPTTLIIGDLAMLHDLNSLQFLKQDTPPLTVIVVNNSGGGIFLFLPIKQHEQIFDPWFSTPHKFTFESAAKMFRVRYSSPESCAEFRECYRAAKKANVHHIIEVKTDQEENLMLHRSLQDEIRLLVDSDMSVEG